MTGATISAYLGVAMLCAAAHCAPAQAGHAQEKTGHSQTSQAQARQAAGAANATAYEVRIAATTMAAGSTSMEIGDDRWQARGYDLKSLIAQIYELDPRRIDLAQDGDPNARYDVTLALPKNVGQEEMQRLLADAVERKFSLDIKPETRSMLAYVMTAPNGPGSGLHLHSAAAPVVAKPMALELRGDDAAGALEEVGEILYEGRDCHNVASNGITATAETIDEFGGTLEGDLDRVLIDETNLTGTYDFRIGSYANKDELFQLLRDQLGLVVRPAERKVTVLRVRPHGEFAHAAAEVVPAG